MMKDNSNLKTQTYQFDIFDSRIRIYGQKISTILKSCCHTLMPTLRFDQFILLSTYKLGLYIALVPVNMTRLSFGEGLFSETNFFAGTCLKNKIFCRTKNYKMGPVIMCHVCKSSQKWGQRLF